MSTTKTLNYSNFLDLGGRSFSKPTTTRRRETTECASKSGHADIVSTVVVKGGAPMTLVIHQSGPNSWVSTYRETLSGWTGRRSKDIDLHCVYSAGGRAVVRPLDLESSAEFKLLRDKIREFAHLPYGWDSYEGTAPPGKAIDAALAVANELERAEILPEWVVPTSDSSILMSAKKRGTLLKWEIDSDGDVAVMLKPKFSPATYHDLEPSEIGMFLQQNLG
jgi:hypothetical protein